VPGSVIAIENDVAAAGARDIAAFLLLVAVGTDIGQADIGMQTHHQAMGANPRDLFNHDRIVKEVDAAATVLGRRIRSEKTGCAQLAPALAIAHAVTIPLRDLRYDLGFHQAPDLGAKKFVFLAEDLSAHQAPPDGISISIARAGRVHYRDRQYSPCAGAAILARGAPRFQLDCGPPRTNHRGPRR
jgi:hypothetical protein